MDFVWSHGNEGWHCGACIRFYAGRPKVCAWPTPDCRGAWLVEEHMTCDRHAQALGMLAVLPVGLPAPPQPPAPGPPPEPPPPPPPPPPQQHGPQPQFSMAPNYGHPTKYPMMDDIWYQWCGRTSSFHCGLCLQCWAGPKVCAFPMGLQDANGVYVSRQDDASHMTCDRHASHMTCDVLATWQCYWWRRRGRS